MIKIHVLKFLSIIFFVVIILFVLCWYGFSYAYGDVLKFPFINNSWTFNNFTLSVDHQQLATADHNYKTYNCKRTKNEVYTCDSDLGKVIFIKKNHGVDVKFLQNRNINYPYIGYDAKAFLIPSGEGLYIPRQNSFWTQQFKQYPDIEWTMPFLGIEYKTMMIGVYSNHMASTHLKVSAKSWLIHMVHIHMMHKKNHTILSSSDIQPYTIKFRLLPHDDILGVAKEYRLILKNQSPDSKFLTLKDKAKQNKNIKKLYGAFHVWVFRDAEQADFVKMLQHKGIKKLWLGYQFLSDTIPQHQVIYPKAFVKAAVQAGYLVGPYVTFENYQNPKHVDDINGYWKKLGVQICIRKKNAHIKKGFQNRGCYVSSQYFASQLTLLNQHFQPWAQHANSLFIDVDGTYPFFNDYSKNHPMSVYQDVQNRKQRLHHFSKHYVVGTETALSIFYDDIAFTNGVFLGFPSSFWTILRNRKHFGQWWPPKAPRIFFKPVRVPKDFIKAAYNPVYRLPLYQAVLHDSVVTTDRWELNLMKIPAIVKKKILLESLYNIPPIWVMDRKAWKKHHNVFLKYYAFFSPIHAKLATHRLIKFQWLTSDHQVQQTIFDDGTIITANFSTHIYNKLLKPNCVMADMPSNNQPTIYCP